MASSLNKAMIIGNLTRDPEARALSSGQTVSKFGIATNRVWKDQQGQKQEKVDFHNVVAWGKLAEICNKYLQKGKKVYIEGRLQTSDWAGQDGVKRYKTEIIAENMLMLSYDAPGGRQGNGFTPQPKADQSQASNAKASNQPSPEISSTEDIPVIQQDTDNYPQEEPENEEINVNDIPF